MRFRDTPPTSALLTYLFLSFCAIYWKQSDWISDKDYKPEVPSHNPCCKYLWDVKEPTHYS